MNRKWYSIAIACMLAVGLLIGCTQAAAPAKPAEPAQSAPAKSDEKPAAPAAAKPADTAAKPAEKPAQAAAPKPAAKKELPSTMSIGSGTLGGGQHGVGTGVAKVVSDHTPIKVLVKPFAGPAAWMPMIETGELEMGVQSGPDAGWAYGGTNGYPTPAKQLRMVMSGNLLPTTILVVKNDSDIKSIKDLKGKRVAAEYGGNVSIRENLTAALESVGLTWNDVKQVPVTDHSTGIKALREGRADAAFGGTPTHATTMEFDAAMGARLLNFGDLTPEQAEKPPKAMVDQLQKRQPGAEIYRAKKEGYMKTDAAAIRYPVLLMASAKANADAIYEVTKALYDFDKDLQPIHAWTKEWAQATMFSATPAAPYHDGAIRFWKEKGKWTPEVEAYQKKLLGQ